MLHFIHRDFENSIIPLRVRALSLPTAIRRPPTIPAGENRMTLRIKGTSYCGIAINFYFSWAVVHTVTLNSKFATLKPPNCLQL